MTEDTLEKVVETPAIILDKTIKATQKVDTLIGREKVVKKAKAYWHNLGPGLTTGSADDDPAGIATYSQTGAQFGFQLIWLSLFTFPFMSVVQEMCARLGIVTGSGLAASIKKYYPKWVLYSTTSLLFIANTLNLGADLGAMAKATQLIINIHFAAVIVFFAALTLGLQIFTTYNQFAKYLKYLAMILLSYVVTAMLLDLNWTEVLKHTVIPSITFSKEQIFLVCGILGTTISPYLFFWQTSQEVEQQQAQSRVTEVSQKEIKNMRIDVWSGMFVSNLVMFFIIAATAGTLFFNGVTNISTAADAASALKPFAGDKAYLLFTIGIIGTGILAIPTLAGSASYALSESLGWRSGLNKKLSHAYSFYGVIIISTLIGLWINFLGWDPIKVLIYSAVVNGLIAPVILFLIVKLSSNKGIMGEWVNKPIITLFGWLITIIMVLAGAAAIISNFI